MGKFSTQAFMFLGLSALSGTVLAGEQEDTLINKMVTAYGGDQLLNLKSVKIHDDHKRFTADQSYSAGEFDLSSYNTNVIIDFENSLKEFQFVGGEGDSLYVQHYIYNGDKGFRIYHDTETLIENGNLSFASVDRRTSTRFDPLIVKLLHENRNKAVYEGEVDYQGKAVDKISFQAEGYPKYTLFVDKMSDLLVKMTRPNWLPNTNFVYNFSEHTKANGITFASELYVTKAGKPENISVKRSFDAEFDVSDSFKIPRGYGEQPATLSFDEMMVTKLADGVYHAGKDWGFSIFVDAGDHYIGMGGYSDLKARLEAVHKAAGNTKPLKYQIVTHHHSDHLGGMREAAELGASFITVPENIAAIRRIAGVEINENRFITVAGSGKVASGLVRFVDFPNSHAAHNLIPYIPSAKMVFTADLFLSRQVSGSPRGSEGLVKFNDAIEIAGFDADYFVAAHSGRVLTADDLKAALKNMRPDAVCPTSWDLCSQ